MWEEQKRTRFEQLRQRQGNSALTEAEQAELAHLTQELEAAEAGYLTPAVDQVRQERETLETQNRILEALTHRKEALVRRLGDFLAEIRTERQAIDGELAAVLGGSRGLETDE